MTRHALIHRLLAALCLLGLAASLVAPVAAQDDDPPDPGPKPGAIGQPVAPLSDKRVYDVANLLNNGQEASIEMDASRLARHGVPVIIVVQRAAMTPDQAGAFAADIRTGWGVESRPGADDGLVMLITAVDTEDQHGMITTLSWGGHALPHFGVDETTSAQIQHAWLDRYIESGQLYEGIVFTLRRLIYHSIYEPAPHAPPTGIRAAAGSAAAVAGTALAIAALALAGWYWTRDGSSRREAGAAEPVLAWGVPVIGVAVFALAVVGQSGWGVVAAMMMLGIGAADWVARDPRRAAGRVTA
jgi:uncharacterized membrane protein YgcG